jgi:hypothetical protein
VIGNHGSAKLVIIMHIRRIPDTQEFQVNADIQTWSPFSGIVQLVNQTSPGLILGIL